MRPLHRHIEEFAGQDIRGADTSADHSGAGAPDAGVRTLGASETEFHDSVALCGVNDTGRLCGDQRLMVDNVQKCRFNKLGLHQWRNDLDERLSREDNRSLRNCVDIPGKMEASQILQKIVIEQTETSQVFDILRRKMKIAYVVDYLLQAAGYGIASVAWVVAVKSIKDDDLIGWILEITLHHGQFIEIGHHRQISIICHYSNLRLFC